MSNDIILTVDKKSVSLNDELILKKILVIQERRKIFLIDNQGFILTYFQEPNKIINEVVLQPDCFQQNLKIIALTFVRSPFNVFNQNGKWTLVVLYSDGRLRFWDALSNKCYLVSKYNFFKNPNSVQFMGSILEIKKRFLYIIINEKKENFLIIFDIWNQKKIKIPLGHDYQIIDAFSYRNMLFLLDVDQKIIVVDTRFLATEKYTIYQNISINENLFIELRNTVIQNIKTYFIPMRTVDIRFDSILTLDDYDLKNYSNIVLSRNNMITAFTKNYFLIFDYKELIENESVQNYDTYKNYLENNFILKINLNFNFERMFKIFYHEEWHLFLYSKEGNLYYISEQFLIFIWQFKQNPEKFIGNIKFLSQQKKLLNLEVFLPVIFTMPQILSVTLCNQTINIFTTNSSYYSLEMKNFIAIQKNLISLNEENQQQFQLNFEKKFLFPQKKSLKEEVYSIFTQSIQKTYSKQDFFEIFEKLIDENDQIKEDFVCNFRNNKQSYYLMAFVSGKFLIFPLFIPTFVNYTEFDIYFLDTQIQRWDKVFFKNDSLIITDNNFLYTFETSSHSNWEKIDKQTIQNIYKESMKSLSQQSFNQIKNHINLFWMKGNFSTHKKITIKGNLVKVNDIKILKKRSDEKTTIKVLKNIKVLQYDNRTYQIILLKELYFLLEDFSHENKLISSICDEVNNFLYLCFEDGIIEMFRIELKGIYTILKQQNELEQKIDQEINLDLGIRNAIKEMLQPLKTFNINFHNQKFLKTLLKNYYNTYNDFNNIKWFSQSDMIKKSSCNDIILFHFKFQLNYFNMCFNNFHKYQINSYSFVQPVTNVFQNQEQEVQKPQVRMTDLQDIMWNQQQDYNEVNKKNLFNLNLKYFHLFLNNLSIDRFQFLRQKFNIFPIYYSLNENKNEIDQYLKKKEISLSCDEYFQEIYSSFLRDSLEQILLDSDESEILYLELSLLHQKVSGIHYNPQQFFLNDSDWKNEYLSLFFEYLIHHPTLNKESLLLFAKTFRIKMPLIKTKITIQGLGNTLTHFSIPLDDDFFKEKVIFYNEQINMMIMSSLISFLLTYRFIPQEFSKDVANQIFLYFTDQKNKINVFNLILYFFNDDLFISASTHFLLNKLTNDQDKMQSYFNVSQNLINKFNRIFLNQISKMKNPKEEFSKIELCLLLVLILVQPKEIWSNSQPLVEQLINTVDQITLQNCMQNCFFTISLLKFLIKTLPKIYSLIPKKNIEFLIKNLHYICLYYGLSLEVEQEYLTFLHKGLYENKLRANTQMYNLLQELQFQPFEIRLNIRKKANKLIKNIADQDLSILLTVFHQLQEDYEHFYFTHINIIDLIKFLIRFDDQNLKYKLDHLIQLILKSLDPHKPELRPKCQEFATKTLKSILKKYSYTDFNQKTQHFAVANKQNNILIYDLKMALEWKILKGHKGTVESIVFHPDGKYLGSFSYQEQRAILWEIDHQGFFASILQKGNMIVYSANLEQKIKENYEILSAQKTLKWELKFKEGKHMTLIEKNSRIKFQISPQQINQIQNYF